MRLSKSLPFSFVAIFGLGIFLLAYRLPSLMMFIGDFGWFYLASRDMLLTGNIPLVGIPSSHPWLHQGPIWTYVLAFGLMLSNFHPQGGAVIAISFGIGSIYLIFLTAKEMFGEKTGLTAALLYATSPLVIIHARMPYHTAPIPFFTLLLFYATYKWIKGNVYYFPLALFCLSILYNLELATVIFWFLFIMIIFFGVAKKQIWIQSLKNQRIITTSFILFLLPLIPILIYDTQHGFPQTLRFGAWMGYKLLTLFGYPSLHPETASTAFTSVLIFFADHVRKLLFLPSTAVAILLFLFCTFVFGRTVVKSYQQKKLTTESVLLGLFYLVGLGGFFAAKTISEAYLPMLFPFIIILLANAIAQIRWQFFVLLALGIFVGANAVSLLQQNYLMAIPENGYGPTFTQRMQIAETIVKTAGENEYTIKGRGKGSEFPSYTMSHEYLTWWLGHGPSEREQRMQFTIQETPERIYLEKKEVKQ